MNFVKLISLAVVFLNTGLFLKGVDSTDKDLNLFVLLRYMDLNTLSRLVAFKQYISPEVHNIRPNFGNGWLYHVKLIDRWTRRLGMYGYGVAGLNSYGDCNCMFYTIHTIFHINNITNEKLLGDLNPNLEPAVEAAIRGLLQSEERIKPLNIKRLSQIVWLGTDPYDPESAALFQLGPLLERMKILADLQLVYENQKLGVDAGSMFENVDLITYYNRLQNEPDKIKILQEIWDEFEAKIYDRFGDHEDKMVIEHLFQLYIILLNKQNTNITCGIRRNDYSPKYAIFMIYEDGRHYDVGGLFKLGTNDIKDIKTMYKIEEIPLPILFFLKEDCQLRTDNN